MKNAVCLPKQNKGGKDEMCFLVNNVRTKWWYRRTLYLIRKFKTEPAARTGERRLNYMHCCCIHFTSTITPNNIS